MDEKDLAERRETKEVRVFRDHQDFQETQAFLDQSDFRESKDLKDHLVQMVKLARKVTKEPVAQMVVQDLPVDQDQMDRMA